MKKETAKKIGDHWSEVSSKEEPKKIRWWEFPVIHKHNNELISKHIDGYNNGLKDCLKVLGLSFEHGVSVGCGQGEKEFLLLLEGQVKKFTLFELSDVRIKIAKDQAKNLGLEDRVEFINGDYLEHEFTENVDFVHWHHSLHHMLDVDKAVEWSHKILDDGGVFYMDDYVGPNRFQWSNKALELGTRIRKILPDEYLKNPYEPNELINRTVLCPDPKQIKDPSEAADSERILTSVKKYFPDAEITLLGGVIYHGTLSNILSNIDESDPKDKTILELLLIIDELATKSGIESHYATVLAIKSSD